jgi:hypothetical protein
MHRKTDKTLHGSCASIQPPFSAVKTQNTGKQSAPFERAEISTVITGLEIT